jgi:hypothetical protein
MDVVEARRQTTTGKIVVGVSAAVCGTGIGSLINAYVVKNSPLVCMGAGAVVGFLASIVGGNLGELFRALAVTLLLTLERWRSFTSDYPLMRQLKCTLVRRRNRFPPYAPSNLRRYRPTPEHPLEFSMTMCMLSAGLLGALLGFIAANAAGIFLLPPSLLSLVMGVFLSFSATLESAEGDLIRCSAMKGVGLVRLVASAAAETEVPRKTLGLAGFVGTKIADIDQQFQIKDRVFSFASYLFGRMTGETESGSASGAGEGGGGRGGGGGERPRRRRRRSSRAPSAWPGDEGPVAPAPYH